MESCYEMHKLSGMEEARQKPTFVVGIGGGGGGMWDQCMLASSQGPLGSGRREKRGVLVSTDRIKLWFVPLSPHPQNSLLHLCS